MSRAVGRREPARWLLDAHLHSAVITALLGAYVDPERPIGEQPTITVRREMLRHATDLLKATEELNARAKRMVELLERADNPDDDTVIDFQTELTKLARKAGRGKRAG